MEMRVLGLQQAMRMQNVNVSLVHKVIYKVVFQKWRWTEITVTLGLILVVSLRKEWPMTFIAVRCPHCQSDQIVKRGKTAQGTQRYLCQNTLCVRGSFLLDYCNRGCLPEVKQTIIDMSLNASGVRDTARSLHICPNTVLRELKKKGRCLKGVDSRSKGAPEFVAIDEQPNDEIVHALCLGEAQCATH